MKRKLILSFNTEVMGLSLTIGNQVFIIDEGWVRDKTGNQYQVVLDGRTQKNILKRLTDNLKLY